MYRFKSEIALEVAEDTVAVFIGSLMGYVFNVTFVVISLFAVVTAVILNVPGWVYTIPNLSHVLSAIL